LSTKFSTFVREVRGHARADGDAALHGSRYRRVLAHLERRAKIPPLVHSRADPVWSVAMRGVEDELVALGAARARTAALLTAAMTVVYFGFILLVAYGKPVLATELVPGLSLGIVLGAAVIVVAWVLTWIYVRWANGRYDPALARLRRGRPA
jgi:uncharacterized membrane protein (DUF485 family)